MQASAQMAAGILALSCYGPLPDERVPLDGGQWQGLKRARVVGWDNGKPVAKPQKRNASCACGSGKKAKRCCRFISTPKQEKKPEEATEE